MLWRHCLLEFLYHVEIDDGTCVIQDRAMRMRFGAERLINRVYHFSRKYMHFMCLFLHLIYFINV